MQPHGLIVIDLQNDYAANGKFPLNGIDAASSNAARAVANARQHGIPIFHIRHEFANPIAPFFVHGTDGAQFLPDAQPAPGEAVILKHFANAFRDTPLKQQLDAQNIKHVIIVGAMSHMCVGACARAAADMGYTVTVLHDACATRDLTFNGVTTPAAQVHAATMAALAFAYASVISTDAYLAV